MRPQYFKHRTIFDFNNETNDIGFPLPWKKGNEDNHFLFRLYKKDKTHYLRETLSSGADLLEGLLGNIAEENDAPERKRRKKNEQDFRAEK